MLQEQIHGWTEAYTTFGREMAYPAEYVVRMFKGNYFHLNLKKEAKGYAGKSICDIGCGDGRHLMLFKSLGFHRIAGTEISSEIVNDLKMSLKDTNTAWDLRDKWFIGYCRKK